MARRESSRGQSDEERYGETGYGEQASAEYTGYGSAELATGEFGEGDASYESYEQRALAPLGDESERLPAVAREDDTGPVFIPGAGVSMGEPFIKRRERPLTMRIASLTLMSCILVTGLFAVTPVGGASGQGGSSFQALSGSVIWRKDNSPSFHWYTVQFGDTVESIAKAQNAQIGGIYELNNLLAGQEIGQGKQLKIPDDPNYGKDYQPPTFIKTSSTGQTTYGSSPWDSYAGAPAPETQCGPDGHGNPLGYELGSPNRGAAWVRGFTWFHNGVDMAAPEGNPITAAQAGEVIWSGWDVGGLGYSVKINHCNGISTIYGHMDKALVKVHDVVDAGQQVGLEGSTGWSTGPHLHFMVLVNNVPVDPMPYYGYVNCRIVATC